jgi:regulation of enolase protein 1 (concanavalin A-like superfamily)
VTRLAARPDVLALRVARSGDAVTVEYALAGGAAGGADPVVWQLHRMAWFPSGAPLLVGPMAASPDGAGFTARFRHWEIQR